ncbi:glycosyltransferase [Aromatoleum diolicum]|uniref:Glycosyltransferase n=1 Tax=Aromatoleum diolicum TaxID=75796 RepID=A0ABX1QEF6_9RHOO|nr:glycosyltransferase [Aromatoleum diolicum]NMG75569.1 glycosyltransferase [Aromatoleum diolicum]
MDEFRPDGRPIGLLVKIYPKLSETFILEEILGLERLGQRLHIFALAPPTDAIHHDAVARVRAPVSYLPMPALATAGQFLCAHARLFAAAPLRYLGALRAALARDGGLIDFLRAGWLTRRLQQAGIGHLHTHFISRPADIGELVSKLGLPFSISAHAKDIYLSDPADLARKLRQARFTVTCTEYNRHTLARHAPDAVLHRMYHGVDFERFSPRLREVPSDPPLILAVGRLREKKGFDTLIEAARILRDDGFAFRCEIVGYGEEHARLDGLIAAAGLRGQVVLAGKLPRDEVIARYAGATVFVQPSRIGQDGDRDGIPNVLLEAMAMQLAVISTIVSGIPELVRDEETGLLVDPDHPTALARAIRRLAGDPALRTRLGEAARAAVAEGFDNDRNLRLLRQLLENSDECPVSAPGSASLPAAARRVAGVR